jgi:hypothetical protein
VRLCHGKVCRQKLSGGASASKGRKGGSGDGEGFEGVVRVKFTQICAACDLDDVRFARFVDLRRERADEINRCDAAC